MEKRSLQYSAAIHLGVFLIAFFGFPSIFDRRDPEPMVMTVEVVPIGAITNLPSQDKPLSKWQQAPTPPTPKKVVPTLKEKTQPKQDLPKDAVPLPDKPAEKKKEEPKKEEVKEDTKKEEEDFDAILKSLQEQADQESKPDAKDKKTAEENKTKSDKPYDPTMPLSISEKDAIRSQFIKCWRMPAGAKNADQLLVRVRVQVSQSGEVTEVKLASGQDGQYRGDPFFKAAADSAIRAVWKCSPLQNLPADKFETWSDMELTFDPSEMLY